VNIFERIKQKTKPYRKAVVIFTGGLFTILAAMFYNQGSVDVVNGPVMTPVNATDYRTVQDFCATASVPPYVYIITVKSNFVWDGASIPRAALTPFGLTPFSPTIIAAALVHDWLSRSERLPAEITDRVFWAIMLDRGTEPHKAESAYLCVRAASDIVWMEHTQESIAAARLFGDVRVVTQ